MKTEVTIEEIWDAQTKSHIYDLEEENERLRKTLKELCETSMSLLGANKQSETAWFIMTTEYAEAYLKSIQALVKQP